MIIAIIILLFASFFFSGSETALTAANKMKMQTEAQQGDKKSGKISKLLTKPSQFITTILIGNNIANIVLPTLITILAVDLGISVSIATAVTTVTIIVISEVIPKSIAATYPDRISRLVYTPISFFIMIFKPITLVLNGMTDAINKFLSKGNEDQQRFSKEEIRQMVSIAGSEGAFNEMERNRIQGVMDFEKLKIKDIDTTPRINVTAFSSDVSYKEAYDTVVSNPYTRYPVYDEDIDNVIGVFHSKYLLAWSRETDNNMSQYTSEALFVNEHNRAEWVLRKMTVSHKHLAIVLDEYGGTDGIVSYEDLIEEMLGMEIEDEMDEEENEKIEEQMKAYNKK
ncbi:MAG: CNNM domain-containing protein [Staphylococcus equorum]|uniref:hemolysin family protein n=1 Tax=Staphylococcus TaxID=1279 RepID=UPI0008533EF4|nr:CNNM domain-containing protein [Staphylococcus equorum]MDG0821647.1 CNNM domain-containing protein [Staphylococcus equorum]MDG0837508.1 CNNM domain-containing protein [Staphylococcus equorum]MDK9872070.1 CNNM domain-containing protein [Staphylococcus equorum]MDK9876822.1 CNNM domain-containing protein [Staphylococcus equorum]MDN5828768.1 CNNM domain-containing protein [Staphylococcus equorum]